MKRLLEAWKFQYGYDVACEGCKLPFTLWVLLHGWRGVWECILSLKCKWKGHDWEDNSHAGPDSGNISMDCKRCGYSFTTWLY